MKTERWNSSTPDEPVIAEIPPAPDWSIYLAIDSSQSPSYLHRGPWTMDMMKLEIDMSNRIQIRTQLMH